jgi:dihydropteroate synthase
MHPRFEWNLGARSLSLGPRTLVMGIVNVTPDSFSDGGLYLDAAQAVEHALRLLEDGADLVDVGGESTRPGAKELSAQHELDRVLPVIQGIHQARKDSIISVDTYKSVVARSCVEAGAVIVNDVSGGFWDAEMLPTLASLQCGVVLMQMRGRPQNWRTLPQIGNAVAVVKDGLAERAQAARNSGIERSRLMLDPGFGFGKNFDENYPLLARFKQFHEFGYPLLAGVSRKSFLGRTLAGSLEPVPIEARRFGTLAAETALALQGAHILRTHDVRACVDAVKIAVAILAAR